MIKYIKNKYKAIIRKYSFTLIMVLFLAFDAYAFNSVSRISRTISNQVTKTLIPELVVNKGNTQTVIGSHIISASQKAIIWTRNELSLWDLYIGKELRRVNLPDIGWKKIQLIGDYQAYAISEEGQLYFIDLSTSSESKTVVKANPPDIYQDVISYKHSEFIVINSFGDIYKLDFLDGILYNKYQYPADISPYKLSLSNDKSKIAILAENEIAVYDITSNDILWRKPISYSGRNIAWSKNNIEVFHSNKKYIHDPSNGNKLDVIVEKNEHVYSLGKGKGYYKIGNESDLEFFDTSDNKLISLYLLEKGWAVIDQSGRYDGAGKASEDVVWQAEKYKFSLTDFMESHYEPGLLALYLNNSKDLTNNTKSIKEGINIPPKLNLTFETSNDSKLTLTAKLTGANLKQRNYNIDLFQNGKLIYAADKSIGFSHIASLSDGNNQFIAIARSNGEPGVPSNSIVKSYRPTKKPSPELHMNSVGINHYATETLRLNYAVNDATAISDRIINIVATDYESRKNVILLDGKASKRQIINSLKALYHTKKEDFVVLYLSGHGVVSDNEWYFLSKDGDSLEDEKSVEKHGISAEFLMSVIADTPAQRILLIVDACQSGAILDTGKTYKQRKALAKIALKTGVHILTATRADQLAPEFDALGHGLFTYTLLNGLERHNNTFNADRYPQDGLLNVEELKQYVTEYVPMLAKHLSGNATLKGGAGPYIWQPMAISHGKDYLLVKAATAD